MLAAVLHCPGSWRSTATLCSDGELCTMRTKVVRSIGFACSKAPFSNDRSGSEQKETTRLRREPQRAPGHTQKSLTTVGFEPTRFRTAEVVVLNRTLTLLLNRSDISPMKVDSPTRICITLYFPPPVCLYLHTFLGLSTRHLRVYFVICASKAARRALYHSRTGTPHLPCSETDVM